jgi:hypothetical protein
VVCIAGVGDVADGDLLLASDERVQRCGRNFLPWPALTSEVQEARLAISQDVALAAAARQARWDADQREQQQRQLAELLGRKP